MHAMWLHLSCAQGLAELSGDCILYMFMYTVYVRYMFAAWSLRDSALCCSELVRPN